MDRFSKPGWAFVVIAIAGCGQSPPAAPQTALPARENSTVPGEKSQVSPANKETAKPVTLVATVKAGTAEAAFQQTLIAFQEGRLEAAFDFLPASYQSDADRLLHDFAGKMDHEIWSKSFSLLARIANLLKTRKSFLLGLESVKRLPQRDAIVTNWDAMATAISDLAESDLSDLERLKKGSVRELLRSAGQVLRQIPLPQFGDVQVTTVKTADGTTTLAYREASSSEPKEVEFVEIEGQWIPRSIATGWPLAIADSQTFLAQLPDRIASLKPVVVQQLDKLEEMVDQLQKAKTTEEFNIAVAPLVFTLAYGAEMAQQAMTEASAASQQGSAIYCVINRELNDDEITRLRDVVLDSLGKSTVDTDYELIPNNGKTRCRFTAVPDAEALVAVLAKHFEQAAIRWDLENKTIHIDFQ